MKYCVYIYRHPDTKTPVYVGQGLTHRPYKHLSGTKNPELSVWLKQVKEPVIEIIPTSEKVEALSLEIWFIHKYGRLDLKAGPLFNKTDGGDGIPGCSPGTKGRKHSDNARSKMSKAHKGVSLSKEARAAISAGSKGKPKSDAARASMSAARKGISQQIVTCPHCNKSGGAATMPRWHFDNCKQNNGELG